MLLSLDVWIDEDSAFKTFLIYESLTCKISDIVANKLAISLSEITEYTYYYYYL